MLGLNIQIGCSPHQWRLMLPTAGGLSATGCIGWLLEKQGWRLLSNHHVIGSGTLHPAMLPLNCGTSVRSLCHPGCIGNKVSNLFWTPRRSWQVTQSWQCILSHGHSAIPRTGFPRLVPKQLRGSCYGRWMIGEPQHLRRRKATDPTLLSGQRFPFAVHHCNLVFPPPAAGFQGSITFGAGRRTGVEKQVAGYGLGTW